MAGNDHRLDALGFITNYIEERIHGLLEDPMNEYQDPNWVQAAELFAEIVVPYDNAYFDEILLNLAQNIVFKAEENNYKVVYYYGRNYNAIANNPNKPGYTRTEEVNYKGTIDKIKSWIERYNKFEDFLNQNKKQ